MALRLQAWRWELREGWWRGVWRRRNALALGSDADGRGLLALQGLEELGDLAAWDVNIR